MPHISPVAHWLITDGRMVNDTPALIAGLCARLDAAGLCLLRMTTLVRTLHPEVQVEIFGWRRLNGGISIADGGRIVESAQREDTLGVTETTSVGHGAFEAPAFKVSPFQRIVDGAHRVRCRVRAEDTEYEYPILKDVQAQGGTDYVAYAIRFRQWPTCCVSYVTDKPDGFSDGDLKLLDELVDPLSLSLEGRSERHVTEVLLQTYLGRQTGRRVLDGHIRRGDVERTEAAIWFSDLRGFTAMSSEIDSHVLIGWLNDYFEAISAPITDAGGEVLKFIGDAVLAVFPVDQRRSTEAACRDALRAALQSNQALGALNARRSTQGLSPLDHGIALHVGEVQYGNIGGARRLDFTVIGPAVNLASRLEGLCGKLKRRLLVSDTVAGVLGSDVTEVGTFELKGITGARKVFAPIVDAADSQP